MPINNEANIDMLQKFLFSEMEILQQFNTTSNICRMWQRH